MALLFSFAIRIIIGWLTLTPHRTTQNAVHTKKCSKPADVKSTGIISALGMIFTTGYEILLFSTMALFCRSKSFMNWLWPKWLGGVELNAVSHALLWSTTLHCLKLSSGHFGPILGVETGVIIPFFNTPLFRVWTWCPKSVYHGSYWSIVSRCSVIYNLITSIWSKKMHQSAQDPYSSAMWLCLELDWLVFIWQIYKIQGTIIRKTTIFGLKL